MIVYIQAKDGVIQKQHIAEKNLEKYSAKIMCISHNNSE